MPPKLNVQPGMRFGQWSVIAYVSSSRHGDRMFRCLCDCGSIRLVSARELFNGYSLSCGHATRFSGEEKRTHGQSESKVYKVWSSMKSRCLNPKDQSYANYGGRGVTICNEWMGFEAFHAWAMLSGYKPGLTIERKDNDGNYSPENCTWIPKADQSNNRRMCKQIQYHGETHTMKDWALILGVPYHRLQSRLWHGWDVISAFEEPSQVADIPTYITEE